MSQAAAGAGDFRDAAVAESEAMLAQVAAESGGLPADPVEAGVSYCLRAEGDGSAALRRLKWASIAGLVLGFAGLLGGALIAGGPEWSDEEQETSWPRLIVAMCCSGAGFVGLFYGATCQRREVRRLARERITVERPGASRPIHVGVEDSATFNKLKTVSEDVAVVILHPGSHCVQIEGVTHRYLIYGDDLAELSCSMTPYTEGIGIRYRVGGVVLDLTLVPNSLLSAFKRQTIGGKSRLHERIRETFDGQPGG